MDIFLFTNSLFFMSVFGKIGDCTSDFLENFKQSTKTILSVLSANITLIFLNNKV
jgi:hypothetical protein